MSFVLPTMEESAYYSKMIDESYFYGAMGVSIYMCLKYVLLVFH